MTEFVDGDELLIETRDVETVDNNGNIEYENSEPVFTRCHVLNNGTKGIIDTEGSPFSGNVFFMKVIRSGRKNMPSNPIGSIVSLNNPIKANKVAYDYSRPVSTSAVTYSDDWKTICDIEEAGNNQHYFDLGVANPFLAGLRGNYRPDASYVYYDGRNQLLNDQNSLSNHGEIGFGTDLLYPNKHSFWKNFGGQWQASPHPYWIDNNNITEYDLQGNEIENKDALKIPSSALFGYNNSKVVAIAQNSEVKETANDNFEDYYFHDLCGNGDINSNYWKLFHDSRNMSLNENVAHTGKYSLEVSQMDNSCFYDISCDIPCDDQLSINYTMVPCSAKPNIGEVSPSCSVDMHEGSITQPCGSVCGFYDSGGSSNYSTNENYTLTVVPSIPGRKIKVNFTDSWLGDGSSLKIFDGGDLVYTLSGADFPAAPIIATNPSGALVFEFVSGDNTAPGWEAEFSCVEPETCCYSFTANVNGTIDTYAWVFGNGYSSSYSTPQVSFPDGTDQTVSLEVTMDNGCVYTASTVVSVNCNIQSRKSAPMASSFTPFSLECEDCLPVFQPIKDSQKEYLLSVWVANDESLTCNKEIENVGDLVSLNGALDYELTNKSPVIDGWQQLTYRFTLTDASSQCLILNNSRRKSVYYDDFRFHPVDANMKSYVYDPMSLRLMAELDENNYATFYEYDDEGNLIRVKRETDKGVKTIQESRTVLKTK